MTNQPSPQLTLALALLAAGTILLLSVISRPLPQPKPALVFPTPILVPAPTILPLLEAGPPRPHVTQTPRGR